MRPGVYNVCRLYLVSLIIQCSHVETELNVCSCPLIKITIVIVNNIVTDLDDNQTKCSP